MGGELFPQGELTKLKSHFQISQDTKGEKVMVIWNVVLSSNKNTGEFTSNLKVKDTPNFKTQMQKKGTKHSGTKFIWITSLKYKILDI